MSNAVIITAIICGTIVLINITSSIENIFMGKKEDEKEKEEK